MNAILPEKIICIVEGHGEVHAVPALIRRIRECANVFTEIQIPAPIRTPRDRFLSNEVEQRKILQLAATKAAGNPILILMDADDDCPVALCARIRTIVDRTIANATTAIVVAEREYESWFLASATALGAVRGLQTNLLIPTNSESLRNCKKWLADRMQTRSYSETLDQPGFSAKLCPSLAAQNSRSFRKFVGEIDRLLCLGSATQGNPGLF